MNNLRRESGKTGPLSTIPLFSRLPAKLQSELFAQMKPESFSPNETIFWMGDEGESIYLVRQGKVEVTVPNESGEHVVLDHLGPGGIFGEISLLDGGPRTATVRAIVQTDVYRLGRADFQAFVRSRPSVAVEFLTVMGQRQRASTGVLRGLKNPNVAFEQSRLTLWQRLSDVLATYAAGPIFTVFHLVWFGSWFLVNLLGTWGVLPTWMAFDPFPFGLLTMVVSLEAIFLSIFVMVSQNRQSEKDRLRIDLDYQINVKAQTEVIKIARLLERMNGRVQTEQ